MFIITKREWNRILEEEFEGFVDVYFRYEYFKLYLKHYDVVPEGIYWEDTNIKVFWTHLIRDISKIEQFKSFEYYDLTTPYGYGGPIILSKTNDSDRIFKSISVFLEEYKKFALRNNYVSEFIRFHPVFENWKFFNRLLNISYLNDVVVVDGGKYLQEIWKTMSKTTRRYIKKSKKEFQNIIVNMSPPHKDIEEFYRLYIEVMKKHNASKKYFFSYEFIKDHFDILKDKSILIYCINNQNLIGASAIFLVGSTYLHYHLGATNYNFKCSPLRLILWNAIVWSKNTGISLFNLGGGKGKNDTLFKFKAGFSNTYKKFYIGKIIFNEKVYKMLIKLAGVNPDVNFFPAYRTKLSDTIV
jgi:hypothetical protein